MLLQELSDQYDKENPFGISTWNRVFGSLPGDQLSALQTIVENSLDLDELNSELRTINVENKVKRRTRALYRIHMRAAEKASIAIELFNLLNRR